MIWPTAESALGLRLPEGALQRYIAAFEMCPIGTPVRVQWDGGRGYHDTITTSPPIMLSNGEILIWIHEPRGLADYSRLTPWPQGGMA